MTSPTGWLKIANVKLIEKRSNKLENSTSQKTFFYSAKRLSKVEQSKSPKIAKKTLFEKSSQAKSKSRKVQKLKNQSLQTTLCISRPDCLDAISGAVREVLYILGQDRTSVNHPPTVPETVWGLFCLVRFLFTSLVEFSNINLQKPLKKSLCHARVLVFATTRWSSFFIFNNLKAGKNPFLAASRHLKPNKSKPLAEEETGNPQ